MRPSSLLKFFVPASLALLVVALGTFAHAQVAADPTPDASTDKYIWLEDVNSPRSLAWVKAENARTAAVLEADPRFAA